MAYRQKRFRYYGHLTDAARMLLGAYVGGEFCMFCAELKAECRCDQARQEEKDG